MDSPNTAPPQNPPDSGSAANVRPRVPHPRRVFQNVTEALRATPFFIDEEAVGPWLSTANPGLLAAGRVLMSVRDALHIPSMEKNGAAIDPAIIEQLCLEAGKIGLAHIRRATGYWTLSTTGELQSENVLIAFSEQGVNYNRLRDLACEIIKITNQDAVAIEVSGLVEQLRD